MANPNAAKLRMAIPVAACIALILLSMGSSPVMADVQDDCRVICRPKCDGFTTEVCNAVTGIAPILKTLDLFMTCKVRISGICSALCINICSLNTLTPSAPTPAPSSSAVPPPCIA
ncbi:unnamed protein product [Urochloa decumbens]|uniref:Uncharacterized protein n=1 Tax=Urochloa decumbens TaxID=240449 RepID=A0ABC9AML8_9POAL